MTTHPSFPPPVADRRAPDRRTEEERRIEREHALNLAAAAAIAVSGGLTVLFVFFIAIGEINLGNALVATLIACALAAVWLGGIVYARRTAGDTTTNKRDRERRGF